jgi:UDP-N-acetylmuramoylalanine--D-glutamate ligase
MRAVAVIEVSRISGMKVTVMGLGLNGGGLASARFFAARGARVTVTDLRGREALRSSIHALEGLPIRYVLERHEERDFQEADLVIKNPAVSPASPFLLAARARGVSVETDLSVFLSLARNPIIAVTGSKGKSTTASAIHFGLNRVVREAKLGGNITVSPLSFIDGLDPKAPVVLELSSWQLGDLSGRGILKPLISAFTVVLPDHMDKYAGMREYVEDKKAVFRDQEPGSMAVFNLDDPWQKDFPRQTRARSFFFSASPLPAGMPGGWLEGDTGVLEQGTGAGRPALILSNRILKGKHNELNLLCAGVVMSLYGLKAEVVRKALAEFPGVEHRLEMFHNWKGTDFYNDSAATIPQATVEAVKAVPAPLILITGGTDKNIDFSPLSEVAGKPEAIVLLAGTGTDKIIPVLEREGVEYEGPFDALEPAVEAALSRARAGVSILFSPGCTSFGMFKNEFDRGARFKRTIREKTARA